MRTAEADRRSGTAFGRARSSALGGRQLAARDGSAERSLAHLKHGRVPTGRQRPAVRRTGQSAGRHPGRRPLAQRGDSIRKAGIGTRGFARLLELDRGAAVPASGGAVAVRYCGLLAHRSGLSEPSSPRCPGLHERNAVREDGALIVWSGVMGTYATTLASTSPSSRQAGGRAIATLTVRCHVQLSTSGLLMDLHRS